MNGMHKFVWGRAGLNGSAGTKAALQRRHRIIATLALTILIVSAAIAAENHFGLFRSADPTGVLGNVGQDPQHETKNAFFESLGTNGRSCVTCHEQADAWTVTPAHIQQRFEATKGTDPIFRTVDGADCPSADVSSVKARREAYSMLLSKGLIRVSIGVPANAEFTVTGINDPHDCPETTPEGLALFRRPLPATNLKFLSTVMWDGRETFKGQTLNFNLSDQAVGATLGHAQAAQAPTAQQVADIVNFELGNFTAQSVDDTAGNLKADGGMGGPETLSQQQFFIGINDPLGGNPTGAQFNPAAFTIFDKWADIEQHGHDGDHGRDEARAAVGRGQELFNSFPITISGVAGLNDAPGVPASFVGNCTTCHNAPNVGNHSVSLALNIGVTDVPAVPALDISGLPIYTLHCNAGAVTPVGATSTIQTTDPGRALITGKCADIGKTKGPILRGLAARAPYFHNGSAATLMDVVNFYDQRFQLHLSEQEKSDLVAFLRSL